MTPALLSLALALPAFAGEADGPGRSLDLPEAYALAIKRSETLAQSAETVKLALARADALRGAILPHLSLTGSNTFQESPDINGSPLNRTSVPLLQLTATQPLFSGFREFLAFKASKHVAVSSEFDERRSRSLLYQDVAQAYLDLLRLQNEISIRSAVVQATQERIGQLQRWARIGRSRESEILAARAQLAQEEALVEIARGQEAVSQEGLRFLTGLEDECLVPRDVSVPARENMSKFLERARTRADVEARRQDLEAALLTVKVEARQRWPTIGLTGDYYIKRTGFNENVRYDAIVGLSMPLFDSGVIAAQTKEARAQAGYKRQSLSLARRSAERDVIAAFRSLEWSLASVTALEKAAALAQANLKAQTEDYRLALVTNLQVLDSISTLQNTRLALNAARLQSALSRAQLEVAAGGPSAAGGAQ